MNSVLVGKSIVFIPRQPTVLLLANTSTFTTFRRRSDEDLFLLKECSLKYGYKLRFFCH